MERKARLELAGVLRERYRQSDKSAKSKILDEFVAITEYHRKYAVRLLNKAGTAIDRSRPGARRIYGEAVKEALIVLWEASDPGRERPWVRQSPQRAEKARFMALKGAQRAESGYGKIRGSRKRL
jgi:hypothetical protein